MVKGNSGKANRNRNLQKLFIVILSCISIIVIYELSGLKQPKKTHRRYDDGQVQQNGMEDVSKTRNNYNRVKRSIRKT